MLGSIGSQKTKNKKGFQMTQVTKGKEKIVELIKAGKTNEEIWNEVGGLKQRIYNVRASLKASLKKKKSIHEAKPKAENLSRKIDAAVYGENVKLHKLINQQALEIVALKLRLL